MTRKSRRSPLLLSAIALLPLSAFAAEPEIRAEASLDLVLYDDDARGQASHLLQETLGIYNVHEIGNPMERGFNLQRAQVALTATLPGWGEGRLALASDGDDARLEEAWLRTQRLSWGGRIAVGKMYSAVGAQNAVRPQDWDFVDQALPQHMLLAGTLRGSGVQLDWSPAVLPALRLGAEWFDTDNAGIAARVDPLDNELGLPIAFADKPAWPAVWSAYAKLDWRVNERHTLQGGLSWLKSRQHQELHEFHPGINDANHGLEGDATMWGADLAYDFNAGRDDHAGNLRVQAEYWLQRKDLYLAYHQLKPVLVGQPRDLRLDAASLQAVYDVAPAWQAGLRYDIAGMTHRASRAKATIGPTGVSEFEDMDRVSAVATWRPARHHRLRLQFSHASAQIPEDITGDGKDDPVRRDFNQVFLQYQLSFGGSLSR
jgi:hypothetical protein